MKLLSAVKSGNIVTVNKVEDSVIRPKLSEMGINQGKQLKVLFRAPLGDPIAVDLGGYVLSLRLDEAKLIEVI